ncbi:MAG: glycosyltransferase, partial [Phycisphaerae bacterium]|nr:glycosyltransferase [Phycisphaerae bacterium]
MKISAIICTSNRPAGLATLLRALLAQQRLPDQLVIVEDRWGPEPREILNAFSDKAVQLCYLRRSSPGLTASRNLALAHASADLLSFFDDDTTPAPDYLHAVEQIFA